MEEGFNAISHPHVIPFVYCASYFAGVRLSFEHRVFSIYNSPNTHLFTVTLTHFCTQPGSLTPNTVPFMILGNLSAFLSVSALPSWTPV